MGVLDDIRHAAFELRETDPQEAGKILRRAAQQGGEAEVLAAARWARSTWTSSATWTAPSMSSAASCSSSPG